MSIHPCAPVEFPRPRSRASSLLIGYVPWAFAIQYLDSSWRLDPLLSEARLRYSDGWEDPLLDDPLPECELGGLDWPFSCLTDWLLERALEFWLSLV